MAGSAAVGVREDGDDNLAAAGDFTRTPNVPVQAGSTVLEHFDANDLNASESLQGALGYNPFSEVNLFIGEVAKKLECAPRAAWERIKRVGDELFRQSFS
jgi:hypothetical protein